MLSKLNTLSFHLDSPFSTAGGSSTPSHPRLQSGHYLLIPVLILPIQYTTKGCFFSFISVSEVRMSSPLLWTWPLCHHLFAGLLHGFLTGLGPQDAVPRSVLRAAARMSSLNGRDPWWRQIWTLLEEDRGHCGVCEQPFHSRVGNEIYVESRLSLCSGKNL